MHNPFIPTLTLPVEGGIFSRAIAFEIPKLIIPAKAGIQDVQGAVAYRAVIAVRAEALNHLPILTTGFPLFRE